MVKNTLEFERSNLLPKNAYNKIKSSKFFDINPFRFRIHVTFESYSVLNKNTLNDLEKTGNKVLEDQEKRIADILEELYKQGEKHHKADEGGDKNGHAEASKLAKNASAQIDDIADGLPQMLREAIDKQIKSGRIEAGAKALIRAKDADAKQEKTKKGKTQTVGTWQFLGSGDGIKVKKGAFKNISAGEEKDTELLKALVAAKSAKEENPYKFAYAPGKTAGIVIKKRTIGQSDKAAAKEKGEGTGTVRTGDIYREGSAYVFEFDDGKPAPRGLKAKIEKAIKDATGQSVTVKITEE